mmetsp:Transcript_11963/g.26603  ORF Transcript_11963/g.26603 Transcript_11963/m.26603 type:complete len:467 (-) Transcript_11963:70-1470(-)
MTKRPTPSAAEGQGLAEEHDASSSLEAASGASIAAGAVVTDAASIDLSSVAALPSSKRGRRQGGNHGKGGAAKESKVVGGGQVRPDYRVELGLRHVEPYDFDFTTHVKQRWVGRTLLEVFSKEFVAYPEDYYRASIEAGRVTVDSQRVTPGHILCEGERIVHRAVRCRENPVLDRGPIPVVAETEDLLVVSKPSSLPIHPCGSYRFNSLVALLREQGSVASDASLHTTHRLDRLTSGLVLLAKTKAAARQISQWFSKNEIRKTYFARVRGSFPHLVDGAKEGDHESGTAGAAESSAPALPAGCRHVAGGRVRVEGFVRCVDHKVGKYEFSASWPGEAGEPKDALTEFEWAWAAPGGESVVRCFPATGRTHQIRVHLLHLGHPIANDSCYGGELRDDPALPLIPHVRQCCAGVSDKDTTDGAEQDSTAKEGEATMHPSGIFLHAVSYKLPCGVAFTGETPEWAACVS